MTDAGPELARELFDYVGFTSADAQRLARLGAQLRPFHPQIIERFYDVIRRHPRASAVFADEAQIERQKRSLEAWLVTAFSGDYDDEWFAQRRRIGEVHVRYGLPQRYMFSAMNIVRSGVHDAVEELGESWEPTRRRATQHAVDRILDVELAIMLQTWHASQSRRLRVSERLATLGQIAASIGHELRNPLAVVQTSVHILERREGVDERTRRHLERIRDQTKLCSSIIHSLLELARDRPLERAATDLEALVQEVFDSVPRPDGVSLEFAQAEALPAVFVDGSQLRQLLVNLVQNAVQAIADSPSGLVEVLASLNDDVLSIEVRDDGAGISEEALNTIFEPLVTGRPGGVGLGLALCQRIADKHGGRIAASNRAQGGASFRVTVPGASGP